MEITRRYRIEVGTSVEGIHTYSCTVEVMAVGDEDTVDWQSLTLRESDALVKSLDERYPVSIIKES